MITTGEDERKCRDIGLDFFLNSYYSSRLFCSSVVFFYTDEYEVPISWGLDSFSCLYYLLFVVFNKGLEIVP